MTSTPDTEPPQVEPFAAFLQKLRRGEVHDELSTALHQLVERVQDVGKSGSVTLTVKVKKDSKTSMLLVADDVKVALPEHDREQSLWFVDRRGNLTRSDPNQQTFETMRGLDGGKTTPQSIQAEELGREA